MAKEQEFQPRMGSANEVGDRECAPLKHLGLPDDLFDNSDPVQAAIDAGEYNDSTGIRRGARRRRQISSL